MPREIFTIQIGDEEFDVEADSEAEALAEAEAAASTPAQTGRAAAYGIAPPPPAARADPNAPAPLATSGGRGALADFGAGLADNTFRVLGGAAADTLDGVTGIVNSPLNLGLDLTGSDFRFGGEDGRTNFGDMVEKPVGGASVFGRALAPFLFGTGPLAAGGKALIGAPAAANRWGSMFTAGAAMDSALAGANDTNLGNLIEDFTPLTVPTARREGENPGIAALKDVAEGGVAGELIESVLRGARALGKTVQPQRWNVQTGAGYTYLNLDDEAEDAAEILSANPDIAELLRADGVKTVDDPRVAMAAERLGARRAAEQAKQQGPAILAQANRDVAADGSPLPETAQQIEALQRAPNLPPQAREDLEALQYGDIDPSQVRLAEQTGYTNGTGASGSYSSRPPPDTIPVDARGRADIGDPGVRAGVDLRSEPKANLPVVQPDAPRSGLDARLSPEEIGAQQRAMDAGQPNRAPVQDTMAAPEGRLPQTRDDIEGQRQAGDAFALAERQQARVEPDVRDTQAAGLPRGPEPERVLVDEGFPVKVVEDLGRGRVKVQRYDPRTGEVDAEGVAYDTHMAGLSQKSYTPEPRRAQDFGARDNPARMSPEQPRAADAPVVREPTQTFRATETDEPFRPDDAGRSPLPEQPEGPMPGRDQPTGETRQRAANDEELRQRYEQARSDSQYEEFTSRAKARYQGEDVKSSPVAAAPADDGRFGTDDLGFVASDKGGPVRFGDQKQAAKWILNVGHKQSPDQIFEIANHPKGGFTARETGRSTPPPSPDGSGITAPYRPAGNTPPDPGDGSAEPKSLRPDLGPPGGITASARADGRTGTSSDQSEPATARASAAAERLASNARNDGGTPEIVKSERGLGKFGPAQLYSTPLDPDAIKTLLVQPVMRAVKFALEAAEPAWKTAADKAERPMTALSRVYNTFWSTNTQAMRIIAKRYPGKAGDTIRTLADMLGTDPGSGRTISQTFGGIL